MTGSNVRLFVVLIWLSSVYSLSTANTAMKRVLVTGGNKGIGKAICQLLLEKHPDVHVLLGSRDMGRGEQAVQDLLAATSCDQGRLDLVQIDTSSSESVAQAAERVSKDGPLYGIINNAGIMRGKNDPEDTVNVNYFGIRRVNEEFGKCLQKPGRRIVNIASASGPNFLASCSDATLYKQLAEPLTSIPGGVSELDEIAKSTKTSNAYGFSKALVNAYTILLAKSEPNLIINSCTPGWIKTDMTAGSAASNPPSKGAVPPVHLLTSKDFDKLPTGRYYGSDCLRSPINVYRNPGDPPYEGP